MHADRDKDMNTTLRGWGLPLLAIAVLALGVAWSKARSTKQAAQTARQDELLTLLDGRISPQMMRFFIEHQRVPRADDPVDLKLPPPVQSWQLRENGVLEVVVATSGARQTWRWVPVVRPLHQGLMYAPVGSLSPNRRQLQGGVEYLNDAAIDAQLTLNTARLFDGSAQPGVPARRHGLVRSANGTETRNCANQRPLLCVSASRAAQVTPDAWRASDLVRLRDADEVCATQFGRDWTLARSPLRLPSVREARPADETWIHDDAPAAANCWASSKDPYRLQVGLAVHTGRHTRSGFEGAVEGAAF